MNRRLDPPRWWVPVAAAVIGVVVLGTIQLQVLGFVDRNCRSTQNGWDSRRQIIEVVTEEVVYPPTDNASLRAAQDAANAARAEQRGRLLEGAGGRPDC